MKAANLNPLDLVPANIIFFPTHAGYSRRMTLLSPTGERKSKGSSTAATKARSRRMIEDPITPSRLAELFALKRDEKAPENFLRDALEVFHRRNAIPGPSALPGKAS
jgi:hypothetical protein